MRGIIKIAIALLIVAAILFALRPIINKDASDISNIESLESIEGIRNISSQSDQESITLKIIVENDLSENQARVRAEELIGQIDAEDKNIVFSLLYEHGYLIGQGGLKADSREIKWD